MDDKEKRRLKIEGWSKLVQALVLTVAIPAFIAWGIEAIFPGIDREFLLMIAGALSVGGLIVAVNKLN